MSQVQRYNLLPHNPKKSQPKNSNFRVFIWENFSGFWELLGRGSHIFGTFVIFWDLRVPSQPKTHVFFWYKCMHTMWLMLTKETSETSQNTSKPLMLFFGKYNVKKKKKK
jgi:hypothetical protein